MGKIGLSVNSLVLFVSLLSASGMALPARSEGSLPQLGRASLQEVIAAMTLEEKVCLVVGARRTIPTWVPITAGPEGDAGPVAGETAELVSGAAGTTCPVQRLRIPSMVLADGPAGLRIKPTRKDDINTYYCTAFPVATLLASSWDEGLVYQVGQAIGKELLEYGVDFLLAPALNLQRNPLCGRNFEYFSEDPLVSGKIAAAMVNGVQSQGVGATIKHFAANNTETNRLTLDTLVSERALRELYLEGFRIAVEDAQPWAVMSSYNKINGTYTSESLDLLTKILRDDWGFNGFVMTDWFGGSDPVAQMKAGNDLLMPGSSKQVKVIIKAVKEGLLAENVLDKNIEKILQAQLRTPRFKGYHYSNKPPLKEHAELARKAATEGMVLLKNSPEALPLVKGTKTIAAFGKTSYEIITGGTGSGDVNEAYSVSLVNGLKNAGYAVNEDLSRLYDAYLKAARKKHDPRRIFRPWKTVAEMEIPAAVAVKMAGLADYAIITIGRNAGEGDDRLSGEGDFKLTVAEKALLRTVADAFHGAGKKCVVILNVGGVIETASWRDIPDAILLAWQAGQETGNCIADVISGKVNPSGKLAATFPWQYEDVPSAGNFPGAVLEARAGSEGGDPRYKPAEVAYQEDIYVGYRYYDSFLIKTAYEFGYGLSYTRFTYGNLKISARTFKDKLALSVDIKNTGAIAGREVVQLYISAPGRLMDKPSKELKGFVKTRLLSPGEIQTVMFEIDARGLASFAAGSSSWVAEAGRYVARIGASSRDIRLEVSFRVEKDMRVKRESKALALSRNISELKRNP